MSNVTLNVEHRFELVEESRIETLNSVIYRVQDLDLHRDVCLKLVRIPGDTKDEVQTNLKSAMHEVGLMSKFADETSSIPPVYMVHFNERQNVLMIFMKWVRGNTLEHEMKKFIPEGKMVRWMLDLSETLDLMARSHIYHKDIKPANIMIDPHTDNMTLLDFNISISLPNHIEGTMYYKAPEMDTHSLYTDRSKVDMFAIGVMLYEYYTGHFPVPLEDYARTTKLAGPVWTKFVEPIEKKKDLNPDMNNIIVKCMKYNPRDRYASMRQLCNELKHYLKTKGGKHGHKQERK